MCGLALCHDDDDGDGDDDDDGDDQENSEHIRKFDIFVF